MNSSDFDPRAETARFLGLPIEQIDYLDDLPDEIQTTPADEAQTSDEEVADVEVAAAESRGLVVPNRISYGVGLQLGVIRPPGFLVYFWLPVAGLGNSCRRTSREFSWIFPGQYSRHAQDGWCPRPSGGYDRRYKIWWRA